MEYTVLWVILAISLALLGSNQIERHQGIREALIFIALSCAFAIFVHKLFAMLF